MPKPRSDSLYARLSEEQREQLYDWLCEQAMGYEDAKHRLEQDHGVKASIGSLCHFHSVHSWYVRVRRAREAGDRQASNLPADIGKRIRDALRLRRFELAILESDVKEHAALSAADQGDRSVELKETLDPQKVAIAKQRADALQAKLDRMQEKIAKAAEKGGLTEETRRELESELTLL